MKELRRAKLAQGLGILLLSVTVLFALLGVPDFKDESGSDPEEALRAQIWSYLLQDSDLDRAGAVERLQSLGARIAGPSMDILCGRDSGRAFREEGRMPVDDFPEILLEALGGLPPRTVALAVAGRLEEAETVEQSVIALRVYSVMKMPGVIEHALEVLEAIDERALRRPSLRNRSAEAFSQVLVNDPGALLHLKSEIRGVPRGAWPVIIQSLGRDLRAEGLAVFEVMLGVDSEMDVMIVEQMTRLDVRDWESNYTEIIDVLEELFDSDEPTVRQAAVAAAGHFHVTELGGALVRLARDDDERVSQSAMQVLRKMSGNPWNEPERWVGWQEQENAWYETHFRRVAASFQRSEKVEVIEALQELSAHRFYRDHLAEAAAQAMWINEETVAKLVSKFVVGLNSPFVLDELVEALEHEHDDVRLEAQKALTAITGEDFGADAGAWSDWLER